MFDADESKLLSRLSLSLTEAATLSTAVGRTALSGVTNALGLINKPAVAVGRFGSVRDTNAAAEQMFDDEIAIRNRRLFLRDHLAQSMLDAALGQITAARRTRPPIAPIVVRRRTKRPVVINVLPVEGVASSPFLGAGAVLILVDLDARVSLRGDVMAQAFGLTQSEARLGVLVGAGISVEQAAYRLHLSRDTVRNELKAIFAKTETHRQGELVALLSKL